MTRLGIVIQNKSLMWPQGLYDASRPQSRHRAPSGAIINLDAPLEAEFLADQEFKVEDLATNLARRPENARPLFVRFPELDAYLKAKPEEGQEKDRKGVVKILGPKDAVPEDAVVVDGIFPDNSMRARKLRARQGAGPAGPKDRLPTPAEAVKAGAGKAAGKAAELDIDAPAGERPKKS